MKRPVMRNLPPESGYAEPRRKDSGFLLEQAPSRDGGQTGRTQGYRDPDDLFGIWTHCEKKTILRTLSRQREPENC